MITRQALYFTAPGQVTVREETIHPPNAGQLLVQTLLSAISPGTEMLLYRGQMPTDLPLDATIDALAGGVTYPLKYGYACVGRVCQIGADVDPIWQDRLVFAFQPHQSHFVAEPEQIIPLPPTMKPETAVFLPNMETAVSFVMDAQPMIGEQVVLFGQGIVGLLTTMLLAQMPLGQLLTVDGYALRRDWSCKLGAHASFAPTDPHDLQTALARNDAYPTADLVFELSGNPQALNQAIGVTGFNGRILIGSWYGEKRADLNLGGLFHRRQIRLISSQVSHINPRWNGRYTQQRRLQIALSMLSRHQPAKLITQRYPIEQAAAAYHLIDQHAETAVQVIIAYPH